MNKRSAVTKFFTNRVQQLIELRTDAPSELEIPTSYRGNLQIALQVED